ncbi:unnamed protein product [Vitrella brassicaformis CCMP3155]|uniref:Uncharacterized protein n=3 Tax=Vitrella brassicaformis TaxID=1169539 RepID=A0A0G4F0B6_VITBC|nr:unnamed protein product [Vitrella brassicaformis CCMP3155]|eukprot:CEM04654.1 unnamed protein product [Vitrella brassicaformis CCMP3155]
MMAQLVTKQAREEGLGEEFGPTTEDDRDVIWKMWKAARGAVLHLLPPIRPSIVWPILPAIRLRLARALRIIRHLIYARLLSSFLSLKAVWRQSSMRGRASQASDAVRRRILGCQITEASAQWKGGVVGGLIELDRAVKRVLLRRKGMAMRVWRREAGRGDREGWAMMRKGLMNWTGEKGGDAEKKWLGLMLPERQLVVILLDALWRNNGSTLLSRLLIDTNVSSLAYQLANQYAHTDPSALPPRLASIAQPITAMSTLTSLTAFLPFPFESHDVGGDDVFVRVTPEAMRLWGRVREWHGRGGTPSDLGKRKRAMAYDEAREAKSLRAGIATLAGLEPRAKKQEKRPVELSQSVTSLSDKEMDRMVDELLGIFRLMRHQRKHGTNLLVDRDQLSKLVSHPGEKSGSKLSPRTLISSLESLNVLPPGSNWLDFERLAASLLQKDIDASAAPLPSVAPPSPTAPLDQPPPLSDTSPPPPPSNTFLDVPPLRVCVCAAYGLPLFDEPRDASRLYSVEVCLLGDGREERGGGSTMLRTRPSTLEGRGRPMGGRVMWDHTIEFSMRDLTVSAFRNLRLRFTLDVLVSHKEWRTLGTKEVPLRHLAKLQLEKPQPQPQSSTSAGRPQRFIVRGAWEDRAPAIELLRKDEWGNLLRPRAVLKPIPVRMDVWVDSAAFHPSLVDVHLDTSTDSTKEEQAKLATYAVEMSFSGPLGGGRQPQMRSTRFVLAQLLTKTTAGSRPAQWAKKCNWGDVVDISLEQLQEEGGEKQLQLSMALLSKIDNQPDTIRLGATPTPIDPLPFMLPFPPPPPHLPPYTLPTGDSLEDRTDWQLHPFRLTPSILPLRGQQAIDVWVGFKVRWVWEVVDYPREPFAAFPLPPFPKVRPLSHRSQQLRRGQDIQTEATYPPQYAETRLEPPCVEIVLDGMIVSNLPDLPMEYAIEVALSLKTTRPPPPSGPPPKRTETREELSRRESGVAVPPMATPLPATQAAFPPTVSLPVPASVSIPTPQAPLPPPPPSPPPHDEMESESSASSEERTPIVTETTGILSSFLGPTTSTQPVPQTMPPPQQSTRALSQVAKKRPPPPPPSMPFPEPPSPEGSESTSGSEEDQLLPNFNLPLFAPPTATHAAPPPDAVATSRPKGSPSVWMSRAIKSTGGEGERWIEWREVGEVLLDAGVDKTVGQMTMAVTLCARPLRIPSQGEWRPFATAHMPLSSVLTFTPTHPLPAPPELNFHSLLLQSALSTRDVTGSLRIACRVRHHMQAAFSFPPASPPRRPITPRLRFEPPLVDRAIGVDKGVEAQIEAPRTAEIAVPRVPARPSVPVTAVAKKPDSVIAAPPKKPGARPPPPPPPLPPVVPKRPSVRPPSESASEESVEPSRPSIINLTAAADRDRRADSWMGDFLGPSVRQSAGIFESIGASIGGAETGPVEARKAAGEGPRPSPTPPAPLRPPPPPPPPMEERKSRLTVVLKDSSYTDLDMVILERGVLDLRGKALGPKGFADMAREAHQWAKKLHTIKLAGTCLEDEGAMALARFLGSGTTAKTPRLSYLDVTDTEMTERGVVELVSCLYTLNIPIKQFSIGKNPLGVTGTAAVSALLSASNTLLNINLAGCGIEDGGARALAGALMPSGRAGQRPSPLMKIRLKDNRIGDNGAVLLFQSFANVPNLREINFGGNPWGDRGASALLALLDTPDMRIKDVDITSIRVSGSVRDALRQSAGEHNVAVVM